MNKKKKKLTNIVFTFALGVFSDNLIEPSFNCITSIRPFVLFVKIIKILLIFCAKLQ